MSIEKASAFYKNIMQAKTVSEPVPLKEHGVYTVFVDLGNTKIEVKIAFTFGNMNVSYVSLAFASIGRQKSN